MLTSAQSLGVLALAAVNQIKLYAMKLTLLLRPQHWPLEVDSKMEVR